MKDDVVRFYAPETRVCEDSDLTLDVGFNRYFDEPTEPHFHYAHVMVKYRTCADDDDGDIYDTILEFIAQLICNYTEVENLNLDFQASFPNRVSGVTIDAFMFNTSMNVDEFINGALSLLPELGELENDYDIHICVTVYPKTNTAVVAVYTL